MRSSVHITIHLVICVIALGTSGFSLARAYRGSGRDEYHRSSRLLSDYYSIDSQTGCTDRPNLCGLRGGPGPDCCRNACVNLLSDGENCGRCGHRCKYPQACCGGGCADLTRNWKHCGRCYNRCNKGDTCSYGMCNYA
ncbi:unnamed protein product [Victoria cruziana]